MMTRTGREKLCQGFKVTDAETATLNIESDRWDPKWN